MSIENCDSWNYLFHKEKKKKYFKNLIEFLKKEKKEQVVFPLDKNIFRAFEVSLYENVKVVIVGQDPYHNDNQANGLSFSVDKECKIPPSLRNIFKELDSDLKISPNNNGDLTKWAEQGVLLLNSVLTVRKGEPNSHKDRGWEQFTDATLAYLNSSKTNLVFILWGNYAINKGELIDSSKHCVISSPHPSPFSARKGFFGSKPFSKTNEYLKSHNCKIIDWSL